jgi:hypothetical protein
MWTGEDGDSLFEEGWIDLPAGVRGGGLTSSMPTDPTLTSSQRTRRGKCEHRLTGEPGVGII